MNAQSRQQRISRLLGELLQDTYSTSLELLKITVPAVIATKILEELGLIIYISQALEPIMGLMGLPGVLGLVWATAIFTTPYSAIIVFAALEPGLDLSTGQVTILCSIMLIAHSLPVELSISKKAGGGVLPIGAIRLFGALAYGIILHYFCLYSGWWQEPVRMLFPFDSAEKTLVQWAVSQILNIGLIIFVLFCILIVMRVMKAVGFLNLLERMLNPVLPLFGMSHRAAPVTVVGMIMGIAYGGALIIRETTSGKMDRRETFNSLALMGLSHGLVEDTLVMLAIGGALGGILWGRLLFSLMFIFLLVKLVDHYQLKRVAKI
jgi:hypothetical protein